MAAKELSEKFSKILLEEVQRCGLLKQTGVSLRRLKEFASDTTDKKSLISAQFLHKELPIRIAKRVIELDSLPCGLSSTPAVWKVRNWYLDSFRDLRYLSEIKDTNDAHIFTNIISLAMARDKYVARMMGLGVQQWKTNKDICKDTVEIHQCLDRFHLSRIGIRMLMGHHLDLHYPEPEQVGFIPKNLSPMDVASKASKAARDLFLKEYESSPDIQLYGDRNFTFPYVSEHLESMIFQLVLNSLRAVEQHRSSRKKDKEDTPPVRILVIDEEDGLIIKISDAGVGIPSSVLPKLFTYLYTTATNLKENFLDVGMVAPIAGYGCDIPITRLYARHFGGDMQIDSAKGFGANVHLRMPRLGDSHEPTF